MVASVGWTDGAVEQHVNPADPADQPPPAHSDTRYLPPDAEHARRSTGFPTTHMPPGIPRQTWLRRKIKNVMAPVRGGWAS
jgi:hypothetical protein